MTPELTRKIRESTHSLIETRKREKSEAAVEVTYMREDVAMLTRAQDFVGRLLAEINHISAILWNARYPQHALPDDVEIYRVPTPGDGRFQHGTNGFMARRDSEGRVVRRTTGVEPGYYRRVHFDLSLSPLAEACFPEYISIRARFIEVFTPLRGGPDPDRVHDRSVRILETPSGEIKFDLNRSVLDLNRCVKSLEDFTAAITDALNH